MGYMRSLRSVAERPKSVAASLRKTYPFKQKHQIFISPGWTCAAYPSQIPYTVLTLRTPHVEPLQSQPGDLVAFDPVIYTEEATGRRWHYTADGEWVYV